MAAEAPAAAGNAWRDALAAAAMIAVDPAGLGGAVLRARAGPARDRWLAHLAALMPDAPLHRIPPGIGDEALLGGLDLAATLAAGRPVQDRGLIARADGGILLLPMAERAGADLAGRLAAALDAGRAMPLLLLDEGAEPEEAAPAALAERLAFRLSLEGLSRADLAAAPAPDPAAPAAARARLARVRCGADLVPALAGAAAAFGIASLRAPFLALRAAKAAAALAGRDEVVEADAELAARLVLAPRATRLPEAPEAVPPPPPPPEPDGAETPEPKERDGSGIPEELLVEAALAALPPDLLARLAAGAGLRGPPATGGAGAFRRTPRRGRPAGTVRGRPAGGMRLDLIASLRAAAPWQPIRRRAQPGREGILVRTGDLCLRRFKARAESAVIFAVDASGSTALQRLGEAKGAVQLLLAEAYVRREQVALVAFRGEGAQVLLPPTRSLVAAKRRLAALPGGGGTPLAAGLRAAALLALQLRRRGATPFVAVLTDGRANIALDGSPGRPAAREDALRMADLLRASGTGTAVIDTGARPQEAAAELARRLGGLYLPLPRAEAPALGRAIRAAQGT
jgi:magnesium chelatase subunit D